MIISSSAKLNGLFLRLFFLPFWRFLMCIAIAFADRFNNPSSSRSFKVLFLSNSGFCKTNLSKNSSSSAENIFRPFFKTLVWNSFLFFLQDEVPWGLTLDGFVKDSLSSTPARSLIFSLCVSNVRFKKCNYHSQLMEVIWASQHSRGAFCFPKKVHFLSPS